MYTYGLDFKTEWPNGLTTSWDPWKVSSQVCRRVWPPLYIWLCRQVDMFWSRKRSFSSIAWILETANLDMPFKNCSCRSPIASIISKGTPSFGTREKNRGNLLHGQKLWRFIGLKVWNHHPHILGRGRFGARNPSIHLWFYGQVELLVGIFLKSYVLLGEGHLSNLCTCPTMLHGTGRFTYMFLEKIMVHVGQYSFHRWSIWACYGSGAVPIFHWLKLRHVTIMKDQSCFFLQIVFIVWWKI